MNFFDVNQNLHDTSIDIILNITWTNQYLLTSLTKDIHINIACERQTFLLAHRHWGTFRKEEPLRLSDRNSILMTKINVYIINPVVMGFQMQICSILRFSWSILVKCCVHLRMSSSKTQMLPLEKTIFHKYWLFCYRFIVFTFDLCGLLSFVCHS